MPARIYPDAKPFIKLDGLSREDWLKYRQLGIGGSDAAAIVGLSNYRSAFDVFLDKKGKLGAQADTLNTLIGRELEDTVARLFEQHTGKKVRRSGFMMQSAKRSWQLADIDRAIIGENAGLECKTTSSPPNLKKLKHGDFPEEYYAQCVHYMAVTGADRWYLAVLVLGFSKEFYVFTIERDDDEIKALCEVEEVFWKENVLKGVEPLPDGTKRTDDYIKEKFGVGDSTEEICDFTAELDDLDAYVAYKAQAKEADTKSKAIAQKLQLKMQTAERGKADGYRITWATVNRSGGIDTAKLESEYPEAFAACAKASTTYRTFKVVKED